MRLRPALSVVTLMLLAAPGRLAAESPCRPADAGAEACLECAPDCAERLVWTYGIAGGSPQGFSLSIGAVFPDVRRLGAPLQTATGLLAALEVGTGSGALRLGPALLVKAGRARRNILPLAGVALTATLVRSWNDPAPRPARTYLGPEILLTAGVRGRVGWLFRLGQHGEPGRSLFSWGVGVGF